MFFMVLGTRADTQVRPVWSGESSVCSFEIQFLMLRHNQNFAPSIVLRAIGSPCPAPVGLAVMYENMRSDCLLTRQLKMEIKKKRTHTLFKRNREMKRFFQSN